MNENIFRIGFVAGPGSGKTTTAADVFVQCKRCGIPVYYVTEYAREAIDSGWQMESIADQLLILKEQRRREDIIPEEIAVMVTDSPTFLTYFYALWHCQNPSKDSFVLTSMYEEFLADISRYDCIILLNRVKPYVQEGTRVQTECESDEITEHLRCLMNLHKIPYISMDGDESAVEEVMDLISLNTGYPHDYSIEVVHVSMDV